MTEPTPALNKALAAFQADLPSIAKGETAQIPGKEGRQGFTYHYADLADVSAAIMPLLGKHGLAFTASPTLDDGRFVLSYTLLHESGEERAGTYPLPSSGKPQDIGGVITYARRYCLCAVTGAAPGGEDNDAAGAAEVTMDKPQQDSGGRWMNRRPDLPPPHLQNKITPGPRPGPELEQLRHGTVEPTPDDRPAQRVKAAQDSDPWTDQPPGTFDETPPEERTGSIDGRQRSQIFAKFALLGIGDPNAQREALSGILRRPVDSRKGLSYRDAEMVLKDLQGRVEAKEAAEQAVAEQDAAEVAAP